LPNLIEQTRWVIRERGGLIEVAIDVGEEIGLLRHGAHLHYE
jgi:hypothetical protein